MKNNNCHTKRYLIVPFIKVQRTNFGEVKNIFFSDKQEKEKGKKFQKLGKKGK